MPAGGTPLFLNVWRVEIEASMATAVIPRKRSHTLVYRTDELWHQYWEQEKTSWCEGKRAPQDVVGWQILDKEGIGERDLELNDLIGQSWTVSIFSGPLMPEGLQDKRDANVVLFQIGYPFGPRKSGRSLCYHSGHQVWNLYAKMWQKRCVNILITPPGLSSFIKLCEHVLSGTFYF